MSAIVAPPSQIVLGEPGFLHDRPLHLGGERLVAVDRHGDRTRRPGLVVDVVAAADAAESPAGTLQRLAHLLAGHGLHTSSVSDRSSAVWNSGSGRAVSCIT